MSRGAVSSPREKAERACIRASANLHKLMSDLESAAFQFKGADCNGLSAECYKAREACRQILISYPNIF